MAESLGKPIVRLVIGHEMLQSKLAVNFEDNEMSSPIYKAFRNKIQNSLVSTVSSLAEIEAKTQLGISAVIKEHSDEMTGWISADTMVNIEEVSALEKMLSSKSNEIETLTKQISRLTSENEYLRKQTESTSSVIGFNEFFRPQDNKKISMEAIRYIEKYWGEVTKEIKALPAYSAETDASVVGSSDTMIFAFDYAEIHFRA